MDNADVIIYGQSSIGKNTIFGERVIIGYPTQNILKEAVASGSKIENMNFKGAVIGDNAIIRSNTTVYTNVEIGKNFRTGHNVLIREETNIGDDVLIGTNSILDGRTVIGNHVSIQGNVYIPLNVRIEDNVFIGPCAVLTNDKYPIRSKSDLKDPTLRRGASVGANSTILPGVEVGEGAMVAAAEFVQKMSRPGNLR